jgi:hypothetical protein
MPPLKRTTILLDADLLDRLERHAHRERSTKTSVIAAAVEAWLAEHDSAPSLAFVAVGRSGHGRLSLDTRSIARRAVARPGPGEPKADG